MQALEELPPCTSYRHRGITEMLGHGRRCRRRPGAAPRAPPGLQRHRPLSQMIVCNSAEVRQQCYGSDRCIQCGQAGVMSHAGCRSGRDAPRHAREGSVCIFSVRGSQPGVQAALPPKLVLAADRVAEVRGIQPGVQVCQAAAGQGRDPVVEAWLSCTLVCKQQAPLQRAAKRS